MLLRFPLGEPAGQPFFHPLAQVILGLGLAWLALMHGGGLVAVGGITGPGFYLSGAIVALAMAAGYGRKLHRSLLRHARR